jgi:hypothetical protein
MKRKYFPGFIEKKIKVFQYSLYPTYHKLGQNCTIWNGRENPGFDMNMKEYRKPRRTMGRNRDRKLEQSQKEDKWVNQGEDLFVLFTLHCD